MRDLITLIEGFLANERDIFAEALARTIYRVRTIGYDKIVSADWNNDQGEFDLSAWCSNRLHEAYRIIADLFNGHSIRIYRAITIPEGEKPSDGHPGIYWAWDREAAYPHHGNPANEQTYLYTAITTDDQIDWVETLSLNASPSYEKNKRFVLLRMPSWMFSTSRKLTSPASLNMRCAT